MLGLKLIHVSKRGHSCYVRVSSLWSTVTQSYWRNSMDGLVFNSLRPSPNIRHFADDIFKCFFENENEWISPRISLKLVPKVRINNIPALVQIMAWRRPGNQPFSEPMMVSLLTHICVTRPQWVRADARVLLQSAKNYLENQWYLRRLAK